MLDEPRRTLLVLIVVVACLVPAIASVELSHRLAVHDQHVRARIVAGEVLHRAHAISEQIAYAESELQDHLEGPPCSPARIERMRALAISASYLQAVGYVQDNRLLCSSYGDHGTGIPLGPPDYLNSRKAFIRRSVELHFGSHRKFFVETDADSGYSSLALPDLVLDAAREVDDISVALVAISNRTVIFRRGVAVDAQHLPPFPRQHGETNWEDNGQVGVIKFSATNDYAAVASVSKNVVVKSWKAAASWVVPSGVLVSAALLWLASLLIRWQSGMPVQLDRAIRRKEFFLVYMPIVDLATGKWVGAEALMRWRRHNGELVGPDIFIPAAERHGRMRKLTARALELLITDAREILLPNAYDLYVSINLSAEDLSNPGIVDIIRRTREEAGLRELMIEATESGLLPSEPVTKIFERLRQLGIRVAIDDFGTGYSNLSYLSSLKADSLKIDKSFVSAIGTDAVTGHVVTHIIEMAKGLHLDLIAEGVQTQAQADYLRARGVRYAQGWLYGKPMPAQLFIKTRQM